MDLRLSTQERAARVVASYPVIEHGAGVRTVRVTPEKLARHLAGAIRAAVEEALGAADGAAGQVEQQGGERAGVIPGEELDERERRELAEAAAKAEAGEVRVVAFLRGATKRMNGIA